MATNENQKTNNNSLFLQKAIKIASDNVELGGGPFGALVVLDQKIIGVGKNNVTLDFDPTAHAEVVAIREACKNIGSFSLNGATLYTSCEPCPMCLAAAYWARIEVIYYGNTRDQAAAIGFDDAFIYKELAIDVQDRSIKMVQILAEEAQKSFEIWKNFESKVPY